MLRSLLIATPVALMAAATHAAPGDLFDCTYKVAKTEWLPERILVFVEDGGNRAQVIDPLIQSTTGDWKDAKVSEVTGKKTALNWTVLVSSGGDNARFSFRWAGFENGKSTISSKAIGYTNQDNARGTCSKRRADQ